MKQTKGFMWTSSTFFGFAILLNPHPGTYFEFKKMKYFWCEHDLDAQNNAL